MEGIGDLSPVQFTGVITGTAALISLVFHLFRIIFMVIEARLPAKITAQGHNGDGRVSKLEANMASLLDRMQAGFAELEKDLTAMSAKMDSQHTAMFNSLEDKTGELHRRVSELRDSFYKSTIEAAKDFVPKKDFEKLDDRVRDVEVEARGRSRNGTANR